MDNNINEDEFIDMLVDIFPEIKEEVLDEDYKGLFTLQIGCFKRFTQQAIDSSNLQIVAKCFEFVNGIIDKVVPKVENALYISYLGHLSISKGGKAEKLLAEKLRTAYYDIHKYNTTQSKNSKLNQFLKDQ